MESAFSLALLSLPNGAFVCGFDLSRQKQPANMGANFWTCPFFSDPQYFTADTVKYFNNIDELGLDRRIAIHMAAKNASGRSLTTAGFAGPDRVAFDADFKAIQAAIERGILKKAVPVAFETAKLKGAPEAHGLADHFILRRLLDFYASLPETQRLQLFLYAMIGEERSIMGLSPEFLVQRPGQGPWRTMALAGSCGLNEDDEALLGSFKERQEHQYVIDDISEHLKSLGLSPFIEPTHVANYPRLKHLRTYVSWKQAQGVLDSSGPLMGVRVAEALHPTAALGVYPRTPEAQRLFEGLSCSRDRGSLGAPIGFIDAESSIEQVTVAIRGIERRGDELWLGSGCGIVAESVAEKEWSELALKRSSMKQILGLI